MRGLWSSQNSHRSQKVFLPPLTFCHTVQIFLRQNGKSLGLGILSISCLPALPTPTPTTPGPGRVLTWIKSSSREALKVQSSRRASFRNRSSRLPWAQCSSTRALIPGAVKKPRQAATLSCRSSRICWGSEHLSSPQGSLGGWTRCSQHLDLQ